MSETPSVPKIESPQVVPFVSESVNISTKDKGLTKKDILKDIRKEKRSEDQIAAKRENRPVTYETIRALDRVYKSLPDEASKKVIESWQRKAKFFAGAADKLLAYGDRYLSFLTIWKIFSPSMFVSGIPTRGEQALNFSQDYQNTMFINIEKDKPMMVFGVQLKRPDLIPRLIGQKILYSLRGLPVRLAADQFEAHMRTEKGKAWLADIAKKKGFRTEEIVHKMTTGEALRELGSRPQQELQDNQKYEASAKPIN